MCIRDSLDTEDILNVAFDSSLTAADFPGLMAMWMIGDNRGFPGANRFGENTAWQTTMLSAINDAVLSLIHISEPTRPY